MDMKRNVLIGLIGTKLDAGKSPDRWNEWRPTVSLFQHEELLFGRFHMLVEPKFTALGERVAEDIRAVSPETEVRLHEIRLRDPWDFECVYGALHDFAKEQRFDVENENYFIHITTGTHTAQICLFLLTESLDLPGALIQAAPPKTRRGARTHSPGTYNIIDLDLSKYDRIAERFRQKIGDDISFLKAGIETKNAAFNRLIEKIEKVALSSDAPILLKGPTGSGKTRLARRIFELKKARRQVQGEFVEVNCATLRGDAAMSALFGHKKGAFTSAISDRSGLLVRANGGVLFLDEVGELGLDEQAMLLRAVEEKRFLPMGADREVESLFQLICGTNCDLNRRVREGVFREDLLARINLWTFELLGLKDRKEDLVPNLAFELDCFFERSQKRVTFNKEAQKRWIEFAVSKEAVWSANFRDLSAAVTRMACLSQGGRITEPLVEEEIERLRGAWAANAPTEKGTPPSASGDVDDIDDVLTKILGKERALEIDLFDRLQLASVLKICKQAKSLSDAGRTLFAVSRAQKSSTNDADRLRKYLAGFGIHWADIR